MLEVGDGIAQVYGLTGVMAGEMVEFSTGAIGLAFNLEENSVGIIILGDYLAINEGDEVRSHRQAAERAGGRRAAWAAWSIRWAIRWTARGRSSRTSGATSRSSPRASPSGSRCSEPLQTGIKAIDAMTPIGRGQRELIIGDRKTGKTAVAIDKQYVPTK